MSQEEQDQERSEVDYMLGSRMAWLAMLADVVEKHLAKHL